MGFQINRACDMIDDMSGAIPLDLEALQRLLIDAR